MTCDGTPRGQGVDGVTGKGKEEEGRRMGEGYKDSRISDRQELPPQREAITGGWRGDTLAGPATDLLAIC